MPALVNSSVGSSPGTSGELGTTRWPCCSKYFRKDARISFAVIQSFYRTRLGCLCGDSERGVAKRRDVEPHHIPQHVAAAIGDVDGASPGEPLDPAGREGPCEQRGAKRATEVSLALCPIEAL